MSADIIILPVVPVVRADEKRERAGLVARIRIGNFSYISICAFTAAETCVPLVEMHGTTGEIDNLTVEQAEAIGAALIEAAKKARGAT